MDAINEIKLLVIDEFFDICKEFTNGKMDSCYLDLLSKILFIELYDNLLNKELLTEIFLN